MFIKGVFFAIVLLGGGRAMAMSTMPIIGLEDLLFLRELTSAVVQESRVPPNAKVGDIGPNSTGNTLIRPGGRQCYPAFWIRDYAMSLDSGLITVEEQRHALLLTAHHQQDTEWRLPNGSVVPPGSIPDHISFGGKPIFYPGTLEDYEGQGGPRWGKLPCLDDHFFFVHMAAAYVRAGNDAGILNQEIKGKPLWERLEAAFAMPPSRPDTLLVYADPDARGVTFGFVDTIVHTGDLLFCSLLKWQAARELQDLMNQAGKPERAAHYRRVAATLRKSIARTFASGKGLLRASTGSSAQPDVWGSAYAVYIGALPRPLERGVCRTLAKAYQAGALAWKGNIRHVLTTDDFSGATAWEVTDVALNRYQNGAYWGTPTGWACYAIAQVDRELAAQLAGEYIAELREGDYRKGPDFGSPWECLHPGGDHRQNPVYMTSVTCPLAALDRLTFDSTRTKTTVETHGVDARRRGTPRTTE